MQMSIAEVLPGRQIVHPVLLNPMEYSKMRYWKKRKRLKESHERKKIGQEIRQEQSWL